MPVRKVVITGMGAVSPYGAGVGLFMQNLHAGCSAVVNMKTDWEEKISDLSCWIGAPLKGSLDEKSIPRKYRKTMGRTAIMSHIAAKEALKQAGFPDSYPGSGRMGVSFASTTGSVSCMEKFYGDYFKTGSAERLSSSIFFQIMSHTSAANIAYAFSINGRVIAPSAACSSSAQAIGLGFEAVQSGIQDVMLCGGSDELHATVNASFDLVRATSYGFNDNPTMSPRPFDKDRDGTVCGEGAGCIALESEESAISRGADILAEVAGFATSSNGVHLAQPDAGAIARCITDALDNAKLKPEQIDYINAHATGTLVGDLAEARAIRRLFGKKGVPVSSLKGHTGHTLGASGALELIACIKMMEEGKLIPTRNLAQPGEGCDEILHIEDSREASINALIKNSFAFGGINTVIVLKRYGND
jgi:3-oxoacyl-[acyl-carrier-protein] synthase II